MPSVKIIHYTNKINADGTSPVVISVYDGKPYKRTLANVTPEQWDEKNNRVKPRSIRNYALINIKISNELNRVEQLILTNKFNLQRDFIDYFENLKKGIEPEQKKEGLSFKEICKLYVSSLKSGASMVVYEHKLNRFIKYSGIGDLRSSEITKKHVEAFVKKHDNCTRSTVRMYLKIVRFASSFAAREKLDTKSEDLHGYKLPKAGRSIKTKLTKEEIAAFKKVEATGQKKQAQDMFMLAIYLRGMRIGDVIQIKQSQFKNGRYVYESEKSEHLFNIKLVPDALEIVNRYLDGREYLFTFFNWKETEFIENKFLSAEENLALLAKHREENLKSRAKHISSIVTRINGMLKEIAAEAGITKTASTHIAKHSFSRLAIERAKGDLNLSMDLVGHSDLKEHQKYIFELTRDEELDAAADDMFS